MERTTLHLLPGILASLSGPLRPRARSDLHELCMQYGDDARVMIVRVLMDELGFGSGSFKSEDSSSKVELLAEYISGFSERNRNCGPVVARALEQSAYPDGALQDLMRVIAIPLAQRIQISLACLKSDDPRIIQAGLLTSHL